MAVKRVLISLDKQAQARRSFIHQEEKIEGLHADKDESTNRFNNVALNFIPNQESVLGFIFESKTFDDFVAQHYGRA